MLNLLTNHFPNWPVGVVVSCGIRNKPLCSSNSTFASDWFKKDAFSVIIFANRRVQTYATQNKNIQKPLSVTDNLHES